VGYNITVGPVGYNVTVGPVGYRYNVTVGPVGYNVTAGTVGSNVTVGPAGYNVTVGPVGYNVTVGPVGYNVTGKSEMNNGRTSQNNDNTDSTCNLRRPAHITNAFGMQCMSNAARRRLSAPLGTLMTSSRSGECSELCATR
jgi:hypothetical protein